MRELIYRSASELARAIREREVSSEEVVHACSLRIEEVNPRLNAVVQHAVEAARNQAREADAKLARGEIMGPLHGVPITIKDSVDTAGLISTGGTKGRASFVPRNDATVVRRLRDAGAVLLGKTNTPELTLAFETDNLVYGRTNNPYDLSRTCGGSSGGAAAILAVGGSALDIGSDTAGSIRVPSHFCGTVGLKPTTGRVPRTGHILPAAGATDSLTQLGPMARSVEDLMLALPIIAGMDWRDQAVIPMPLEEPERLDPKSLRIAFHTDNGILSPRREIAAAVSLAAKTLAGIGMRVGEARPEGMDQGFDIWAALMAADGGVWIQRLLDLYGTTETHPLLQDVLDNSAMRGLPGAEFGNLLIRMDEFRSRMLSFMERYDAIVCPVCAFAALPHNTTNDGANFPGFSYTAIFNVTGWPAAVVRGGTTPDGLPIGVQIVGGPWREDVVLTVARRLEDALGEWPRPSFGEIKT